MGSLMDSRLAHSMASQMVVYLAPQMASRLGEPTDKGTENQLELSTVIMTALLKE